MKNNLPYRSIGLLCLAITVSGLCCCIKDDRTQCEPRKAGLSVIFTDPYQSDDPQRGLNTNEFSRVTLFIYDNEGQLVTIQELYECSLNRQYRLDIELTSGSYDMVAWVGTETFFYNLDHTENLDRASLSLYIPEDREIDFGISHLYFGKNSFKIHTHDGSIILPMLQYTNDINYTVTGLESDHRYSFWIVDDNGKYSFKNSYLPCEMFGYHRDGRFFTVDQFNSLITILRLSNDRNPVLILTDDLTGEIIYPSYPGQETNLITLIKSAYQNSSYDFDARHIFDLSLVFDADMKATVFIDNWEVKESNYEI